MINEAVLELARRAGTRPQSTAYVGDPGAVGILNVGAGDIRLSFDKSNPAERIRAARIVRDMLRRGFALLVEVDVGGEKKFVRATDFNEDACEYIVADFDSAVAAHHDRTEASNGSQQGEASANAEEGTSPTQVEDRETEPRVSRTVDEPPKRGRGRPKKGIPAETARAVAVGRTAGG